MMKSLLGIKLLCPPPKGRGTYCYVPHRRGGGHIVFGVDLVGVGVGIGIGVSVGVTFSCLHDIS